MPPNDAADPLAAPFAELGRWERWTVDEVFDGVARLLICDALPEIAADVLPRMPLLLGDEPGLRQTAMAYELATTSATWTDEIGTSVDELELRDFVRDTRQGGGLPGDRPLREGDVFWVFVPLTDVSFRDRKASEVLAAYRELGAITLDVTAAARQVVKVLHDRAQRAAAPLTEA